MDNKKKFSKTYDKLVDKIYRFVYLKVSSSDIAQDITSTVFTKVWDKIRNDTDTIDNMSAYVYQVARSEVANFYRDKSKYQIISTESVEVRDTENIEKKEELRSDIELVKKYLDQLKDEYQSVILLKYVDDLTYSEMSEVLGKPEGTIRVMVHRALGDLKELMKDL